MKQPFPWAEEPRLLDDKVTTRTGVRLPAHIRRPADNGDDLLEVEFHGAFDGQMLDAASDALATYIPNLHELAEYSAAHAPAQVAATPSSLWLTGVEFRAGGMSLLFDSGDLDLLVLVIATDGSREVHVQR